jgi:hypothetical protein
MLGVDRAPRREPLMPQGLQPCSIPTKFFRRVVIAVQVRPKRGNWRPIQRPLFP